MIDILRRDGLLPLVAPLIQQVQTTARVLQSDTRTTTVFGWLGIVGVIAGEDKRVAFLHQTDLDDRRCITVQSLDRKSVV